MFYLLLLGATRNSNHQITKFENQIDETFDPDIVPGNKISYITRSLPRFAFPKYVEKAMKQRRSLLYIVPPTEPFQQLKKQKIYQSNNHHHPSHHHDAIADQSRDKRVTMADALSPQAAPGTF